MRILVVDDKFESRWLLTGWLTEFLKPNGAFVESAASAEEALRVIEHRKHNLVLASHPLAKADGLELARRVKALPYDPVVVVMADKADAQLQQACFAARIDCCFEKRQIESRLLDFMKDRFGISSERRGSI